MCAATRCCWLTTYGPVVLHRSSSPGKEAWRTNQPSSTPATPLLPAEMEPFAVAGNEGFHEKPPFTVSMAHNAAMPPPPNRPTSKAAVPLSREVSRELIPAAAIERSSSRGKERAKPRTGKHPLVRSMLPCWPLHSDTTERSGQYGRSCVVVRSVRRGNLAARFAFVGAARFAPTPKPSGGHLPRRWAPRARRVHGTRVCPLLPCTDPAAFYRARVPQRVFVDVRGAAASACAASHSCEGVTALRAAGRPISQSSFVRVLCGLVWYPARYGIPHGLVSRTAAWYPARRHGIPHVAWYPARRHGIPHGGMVSRTAAWYPARHGIPHGLVSSARFWCVYQACGLGVARIRRGPLEIVQC